MLAKSVVTVDHISGGRVELGIGAGWYEAEHIAYGFPFLTTRERLDELDRQLAELNRQWGEASDVWPKPLQRPRPPIIVGGRAKPRTVRAAVRFADEYNSVVPSLEEAAAHHRIVVEAAREAGRRPLNFSMMTTCVVGRDEAEARERRRLWQEISLHGDPPLISGSVDHVADSLRTYARVGVERTMIQQLVHEDHEQVALLGDVAAALALDE